MIPRILHFVWVGPPMPEHLRANLTAWRHLHPGWAFQLWNEDNLRWLRHRDLFDKAPKLVYRDAVEQFQSDIARYEILHDHGGFYADCDTHPLRPIDDALDGLQTFAAAEDEHWIGNTYLGAIPGAGVFNTLVDGLRSQIETYRGRRTAGQITGPRYLTPIWRRFGEHIAPQHQWFPYSYSHLKNGGKLPTPQSDAYAVHQWHHTRSNLKRRHQ